MLSPILLIFWWIIGGCGKGLVFIALREELFDGVGTPVLNGNEKLRHRGFELWGRRFGDSHRCWGGDGLEA